MKGWGCNGNCLFWGGGGCPVLCGVRYLIFSRKGLGSPKITPHSVGLGIFVIGSSFLSSPKITPHFVGLGIGDDNGIYTFTLRLPRIPWG